MVVELMTDRLVMVEEAALASIPPLRVASPVNVDTPVTSRVEDRERVVMD